MNELTQGIPDRGLRPGVRGHRLGRLGTAMVVAVGIATSLVQPILSQAAAGAGTPLVGTFHITAGSCSGGSVSGTYLRMVLSGGNNASGPYFSNSDSSCSDNSITPLSPGSAGGLVAGSYQPEPSPAFDASGNALSDQITAPVQFEGVKFSTATNPTDPQTGLRVPAPSISANGSALSGNLQSFGVSWNKQEFNQGSPKPDGSSPGNTTPVTGTYNAATGAYVLQWSSQIVGGPFNGFSAFWNLTGTFTPATAPVSTPTTTQATSGNAGGHAASSGSSGEKSSAAVSGSSVTTSTAAPAPGATCGAKSASGATGAPGTAATPKSSVASPGHASARDTLSARTTASVGAGWSVPTWLIALVALIAALGLLGVVGSERALRRQRTHA
jgi:hypothetical protein